MNRDNVPWPIEGGNDDPFSIIDNVPSPIVRGKSGASSEEKMSREGFATMDDLDAFIAEASAATSDIGGGPKPVILDDLDVLFASSSVTPNNNSLRVKGMSPEQFVLMWREKTGIQHLTYDQLWDHIDRINACSLALVLDQTISPGEQYLKLMNEAMDKSYKIMCNGGTSDKWPYPLHIPF